MKDRHVCCAPQGLEFGRYSLDYHTLRNYLYVQRHMDPERAAKHVPGFAKRVVAEYDAQGGISARCGGQPAWPAV